MRAPEALEVGIRGWVTPDYLRHRDSHGQGAPYEDPGPSSWTLTFDSESTTDTAQRLRVGAFQAHRNGRLRKEGLFYDPAALTSAELEIVRAYASASGIELMVQAEFVEKVFFRYAVFRRALLIGHNLPFDIFRLAIDHEPAKGKNPAMRGGLTAKLSENERRARVQVKRAHPGAAFIRLTLPGGRQPERRNRERGGSSPDHHGYFLDTAALAGALLGGRWSLKRLADTLETEHRKSDADHGEEISPDYLDYLRNDVQVTSECSSKLRNRYSAYRLDKPVHAIYSEASIGKAHLDQMGIRPWRRGDFGAPLIACVMESYYGGRTEAMLRRTPVPGVYLDFRSQYPTAFVLQRLWRYMICEAVDSTEVDPGAVREQLEALDIEAVLNPSLWPALDMLVLIDPDGDRLPTRARFPRKPTREGILEPPRTLNVAVPYRSGGEPQWWTLADCIASLLHTGKAPKIVRAIRFQALGVQEGLQPIDVAGNPRYRIDPYTDDFIKRLVEMRAEVKAEMKAAKRAGELDRARQLDAIQLGMKITANSIAYGVGIEMNVIEHRKRVDATVYLPEGDSYRTKLERSEQPGKWFHPLVATLVTGGGRLLLAAAMHQIDQAGGVYATCDTDAVFPVATKDGGLIPCAGGTRRAADGGEAVQALSWAEVDDIASRFEPLNLFDQKLVSGSILELEDENLDPDSGDQREIECFAIASKRYTLFTRDEDHRPQIIGSSDKRKRSEHGLGHLLPPNALGPEVDDSAWKDRWWEHLLCLELGVPDPEPDFFSLEAVGRLTVTSPREEKTFRAHNDGLPYAERVRPWNFLCMAHPTQTERARKNGRQCLVAPFERDPAKRRTMDWIDRNAPERGTTRIRTDPLRRIEKDSTAVLSYGDYFEEYRLHPEAKALAPDGQPCHSWTRGLLQPRHVTPSKIIRIGKESNRLSETAMPLELDEEAVVEYPAPRVCPGCRTTVEGRRKWCSEACRKRTARRRA